METLNIFWSNIKWRFQNPEVIVMTTIQPLLWLLLFTTMFGNMAIGNEISDNYTAFALPGIVIMLILSGSGMGGISTYSWRQSGVFLRIFISPIKRSSIILGHILDSEVITIVAVFALFLVSSLLKVRINTGILGVLLILIVIVFADFFVSALSYALSLIVKEENSFIAVVNMFMLPLFFASTALVPYENIPFVLKIIVTINPFTYSINALRSLIMSDTIQWITIGKSVGISTVLCVITFAFALKNLNRNSK